MYYDYYSIRPVGRFDLFSLVFLLHSQCKTRASAADALFSFFMLYLFIACIDAVLIFILP